MKNLFKIFFAVVAFVAYSCTNDTTEDLGIQFGDGEGQTLVSISLEESRTHLGEKANNLYPVYWCEGDQICINGVASLPLSGDKVDTPYAQFAFDGNLERPFNVIYPVPAEGVTAAEGLYPVTFLAEQSYTNGTFCEGAAPMYGYAEALAEGQESSDIQMHHLSGVLRFAVKGTATLKSLVITAEKGKLSGNFDVNCKSGALTAHEDASNTVTVTFGENGLQLGEEATPIYVAVPAGEFGVVTITLTDTENGVMNARFHSDYHPVAIGKVKEFTEFAFIPNAEASAEFEGDVVLMSATDLHRLARQSEISSLDKVTSVTVGATIEVSASSSWSPIQNFPAITFDGGSDKGFEIKGLTAPLFNTLDGATIKNVKLTGVNITENKRLHVGSLVCDAVSTTIDNCSAAGSLTFTNSSAITDASYTSHSVGGLIGNLTGASVVKNTTSNVNVTLTKYAESCNSKVYNPFAAMIGYIKGTSTTPIQIQDCTNLGTITSNASNLTNVQPTVGGIAGMAYFTKFTRVTNGQEGKNNYGDITLTKSISAAAAMGGIVAAGKNCEFDTVTNYGTVKYMTSVAYPYVGGVFGTWWANDGDATSTLKNVTNYGDIIVSDADGKKISNNNGTPYFGGIIGRHAGTKAYVTLDNCDNYGDVRILADFKLTKTNSLYLGGVVGGGEMLEFKDCDNYGTITQDGVVNTNKPTWDSANADFTHKSYIYVGGIAGKAGSSTFNSCDNNGPINVDTDVIYGHIGGVVGTAAATSFTENTNGANGDITVAGSFNLNVGICGISSSLGCATSDCSNAGDITVSASEPEGDAYTNAKGESAKATGAIYINGLAWTSNYDHSNFTNSGNITFTGDCYTNVFISGAVYTPSKTITNVHNTGTLSADVENLHCTLKIGGICRSSSNGTFSKCSNSGDLVFKGTATGSVCLGGLAGDISGAMKTTNEGFTNSGTIKWLGHAKTSYVGGIAGSATAAVGAITTLKNTGTVTNYDEALNLVGTATTVRWGGAIGSISSKAQSVAMESTGDVTVKWGEKNGTDVTVGGFVGSTSQNISNFKVKSNVTAYDFPNVGVVTGAAYTAGRVSKCQVGGKISGMVYIDGFAGEELVPGMVTLDSNNFYKYIYSNEMTAAQASTDSITLY